ncbi:MAG: flagellar export chaperone FliS [Gaiellales bacterium]
MTVAQRNASRTYNEAAVMTATPGRLVLMLYAGAVRFLTRAEAMYRNGDRLGGLTSVNRAIAIVDELNVTLDMNQGDVAHRLRSIYLFAKRELLQATVKCDPDRVATINDLIRELHTAWEEIVEREGALTPEPLAS